MVAAAWLIGVLWYLILSVLLVVSIVLITTMLTLIVVECGISVRLEVIQ